MKKNEDNKAYELKLKGALAILKTLEMDKDMEKRLIAEEGEEFVKMLKELKVILN